MSTRLRIQININNLCIPFEREYKERNKKRKNKEKKNKKDMDTLLFVFIIRSCSTKYYIKTDSTSPYFISEVVPNTPSLANFLVYFTLGVLLREITRV